MQTVQAMKVNLSANNIRGVVRRGISAFVQQIDP